MKKFLNENKKSIIFFIAFLVIFVGFYFLDKDLGKILGIVSIFSAFFVWFLREYTKQLLAKDLEKFKNDLEKESIAFKTKYEKIHTERAELIKELYYKFYEAKNYSKKIANKMSKHWQFADEEGVNKEEYEGYINLLNDLREHIERNRIFFSDEKLVNKMTSVVYDYDDALNSFSIVYRNPNTQEEVALRQKEILKIYKTISGEILKPLEIEFKKILGIEHESGQGGENGVNKESYPIEKSEARSDF